MAANAELQKQVDALKYFLASAPANWEPTQAIRRFLLPNGEYISCVMWKNLFHVTGTDIMRALMFRFQAFGRPIKNMKKFEEGVFSDLRNLKAGIDACLEGPRSEFLEMLHKNNCIRTQKKQKVFYWFSVPHDRLFIDALERDLKRESLGQEPTTVAVSAQEASVGLLPSSLMSSAHTQFTHQNASQVSVPTYTTSMTNATPQNEFPVSAPSYNTSMMNALAGNQLGMQGLPLEPILHPLISNMASMGDWIADDAPLAPNVDILAQKNQLGRSVSWDDGFVFNGPSNHPFGGLESSTASFKSEPLIRSSFSDNTFGCERSDSNSSLSSLLSLDQGYGSFDDTSKLGLLQEVGTKSDLTLDFQESVSRMNLSQKPSGGHFRAHSFSHNLAASAMASPNPLFGMYSMFDGSPNYKQRRRSSAISNCMGHRRSVSTSNLADFHAEESLCAPSMDGESRVDRRIFNCNFDNCGRKFKRYEHLKRHYRTHSKERPYLCMYEGCDKSFSRSDNLVQHIRIHKKVPSGSSTKLNSSPIIAESLSDCSSESSEHSEPSLPNSPTNLPFLNCAELDGKYFSYEDSPLTSPHLEPSEYHSQHDMDYLLNATFGLDPMIGREISYFGV